jgi:hypothetical protein
VAPAKRTVVFHPAMEIGIDVDCKSPDRADQIRTAMAELLRRDGYKIGKGSGWRIAMQAEQIEIPLKFNLRVAPVPGVKGSVNLVGPDGPVGGGEIKRDVSNLKSKYELKRDKDGHRFFDFEGENAYKSFENEYWDAWVAQIDSVRWPRAVMRADGKYAPLPAKIRLDVAK